MKYLVGIPCLYGVEHTREAIDSVIKTPNTHLLLIDNGSEISVKDLIYDYALKNENVSVIHNKENIYVNPAWNQILTYFLDSECDRLLIMNSDLVLQSQWNFVLNSYLDEFKNDIPVPFISNDRKTVDYCYPLFDGTYKAIEVTEGTPGVLIVINKEHASNIYPIPETIKVWFGDNWIYEGLRKLGYKTVVLNNLIAYHSGSQNVSKVEGIGKIIEQDKIEWEKLK